jgi:hypothetical protein
VVEMISVIKHPDDGPRQCFGSALGSMLVGWSAGRHISRYAEILPLEPAIGECQHRASPAV